MSKRTRAAVITRNGVSSSSSSSTKKRKQPAITTPQSDPSPPSLPPPPPNLWDTYLYEDAECIIFSFLNPLDLFLFGATSRGNKAKCHAKIELYHGWLPTHLARYGTENLLEAYLLPGLVHHSIRRLFRFPTTKDRKDEYMDLFASATHHGNGVAMKWLHAHQCPTHMNGNGVAMKWLHAHQCPMHMNDSRYMEAMVKQGNFEMLQWLHAMHIGTPNFFLLRTACEQGDLPILKWVWNKLKDKDGHVFLNGIRPYITNIIASGSLPTLEWFVAETQFSDWEDYKGLNTAAFQGHFHLMKWLRERGCPWDPRTFMSAFFSPNLDTLKWMLANGCPWGEASINCALDYENITPEIIAWLRENGCPQRYSLSFSELLEKWRR